MTTHDEVQELVELEIAADHTNPRLIELRKKFAADPSRFSIHDYMRWGRDCRGWSKRRAQWEAAKLMGTMGD